MRLIDADKQLEWVDCMTPIHGIGLEPVVAVETVRDLIKGAPTINAIPVEWLENRLNTLCFEAMGAGALYGDRIGELAKSINEVMKLWQKEQEART